MKKILALVLVCLLTLGLFTACSKGGNSENTEIKVMMVDGAPLLSMAKMAFEGFDVESGYKISYTTAPGADALVASLLNKEPDFAIAPINVAATMHNNGSGYRLAAVSLWGIMHIVSNQNIMSLEELKGETIFAFAKSGTPGITLRAVLKQNGIECVENQDASYTISPDKVHIIYLAEASDVKNAIIAGTLGGREVKYGLLAEPVSTAIGGATASSAHGQFTAKINLQTEWAKNNGGQIYPQAALIFHERLLENDSFVKKFIAMAEWSTLFAKQNAKDAGDLAVEFGSIAIPNGTVVQNAVNAGRLPLDFTRALKAKESVEAYLQIILSDTPTLIGGKLPSDSFYYAE